MIRFKVYLRDTRKLVGKTIHTTWAAVRRWFYDHNIGVTKKCTDVQISKTRLDNLPSKRDVKKVLDSYRLEYKVVYSLMVFSGMRPSDTRNIQYKNIKKSYEEGDTVLMIILKQRIKRE